MTSAIEIQDLNVSYGSREVLRRINLAIPSCQITAIIGPSGCGKTTLLRCLNRLSELTPGCRVGGKILLDGQDIQTTDPILVRRRVGMVFQKPNPFPMSIRDNVLYGLQAAGTRTDGDHIVQATLAQAALWDEIQHRLGDNAYRLSLGQQQRLCIARTLAVSPEVILMDEPVSSLDPPSAAKVEESIRGLRGKYTVVIVTHNMQQAMRLSDNTAFLYMGELVEYGPTAELFERPQRPETKEYITGKFG